jgi:hypothetical protein
VGGSGHDAPTRLVSVNTAEVAHFARRLTLFVVDVLATRKFSGFMRFAFSRDSEPTPIIIVSSRYPRTRKGVRHAKRTRHLEFE